MVGALGKCYLAYRLGEEGLTRLNLAGRICPLIRGFVQGFCGGFAVLGDKGVGSSY
jgi:hypothetical protein